MVDVTPENLNALAAVPVVTVAIVALAIVLVVQAWSALKQTKSMTELTVAINNFVAYSDSKNKLLEYAMNQQSHVSDKILDMLEKHEDWAEQAITRLEKKAIT